jgi:hypothetical protein
MSGPNRLYLAHQRPNNFHDQFQQTQSMTQPYWSTMNQSLYLVPPQVHARNTDFLTTQPSQDHGAEFLQNFVSGVDARVQALNLGPTATKI